MNSIGYHDVLKDHVASAVTQGVTPHGPLVFVIGIPQDRAFDFVDWFSGGTEARLHLAALHDVSIDHQEVDRIAAQIRAISQNDDLRDEDEPPPPQRVIEEAIRLIRGASDRMLGAMAPAQVSTFFGELNVTWKVSGKIVRLACFPDRATVMQTGSLSMPLGSYKSEPNPSPATLAEQLDIQALENDLEERPFLG